MEWFYAAFAAAVFFSILNFVTKKLTEDISDLAFNTLFSVSAMLVCLPVFLYFSPGLNLGKSLLPWTALLFSGIANTFGVLAYNVSIKHGEISEVIPLTKLTPVFTAIFGVLILNEVMNIQRVSGILAVTLGSFIVLLKKGDSILKPLKRLKTEKAATLAFSSSIIYAFASIADKYTVETIHPELYVFFIFVIMSGSLTTYLGLKDKTKLIEAKNAFGKNRLWFGIVGILAASAYLSIFYAYSLAPASKVVPVLQIQVLASVAVGGYIFKEKDLLRKLIGSIVLIAGVILIAI